MSNHINQIVHEWSYRVNNGMPDVKNPLHLVKLKTTLHEMKYPKKFVETLLSRLREVDESDKYVSVRFGRYKLKKDVDPDGKSKPNTPTFEKDDAGKFVQISDDEPGEKEEPKPEPMKIDADPFADDKEKTVEKPKLKKREEKVEFSALSDKAIAVKMKNIQASVDAAPTTDFLTDEIKKQIPSVITKMMRGDELDSNEQKIVENHFKFIRTESGRTDIYMAHTEEKTWYPAHNKVNLFSKPGKKSATKSESFLNWMDGIESKYPFAFVGNTSQGAIGKKQLVPDKMGGETKVSKVEKIENGVSIDGKQMKRIAVPDRDTLVQAVAKANPDIDSEQIEREVEYSLMKIERYNAQIDELAKKGDFSYIDFGKVDTSENRSKTIHSILSKTEKRFTDLLNKAGDEVKNRSENKQVFNDLNNLKIMIESGYDENDESQREKFKELLNNLEVSMASSMDFKDTVADYAEIKVALQMMSQGYPTYLPDDPAYKVSDLLIVNPIDTSKININSIDELAKNLQFFNVSLEYTGGVSVKYKGGGGGISDDKIGLTEYNNKETRNRLMLLTKSYDFLYPKDKNPPNYPPSQDSINKRKALYEETKEWAKGNNIISDEEVEKIETWANDKAEIFYERFMKKGVGNCMDDEGKERYKESIRQYLKEMKMMENINNNDMKYTKFGNSNQKISLRGGKPDSVVEEIADGIKTPCYMKFKDDPGFSYATTSKGCTVATPTNRNPSSIKSHRP